MTTRNSYGCQVLNTPRAMFVDVDLPEPKPTAGGWLKRLWGTPEPPRGHAAADRAIARAESWAQQHPGWGWRIYRTRAGLRLLATHAPFDPEAPVTDQVFEAMGADPLYRRLCRAQNCLRARLMPKPWRCNLERPPARWPWPDARAEAQFRKWEARYEQASQAYATCQLTGTPGARPIHPLVQLILQAHDEATKAEAGMPLA